MIRELVVGVHSPTGAAFPVECVSDEGLRARNVRIAAAELRFGAGAAISLDVALIQASADAFSVAVQISLEIVDPITGTLVYPQVLGEEFVPAGARVMSPIGLTVPMLALLVAPPASAMISITREIADPKGSLGRRFRG